MALFFQFDTRAEHGLTLPVGSHVMAFMSPEVNEIDYFGPRVPSKPLPPRYWEMRLPHFRIFVFTPDVALEPHADACAFLLPRALDMEPRPADVGEHFLLIGGRPIWYQGDETLPGFDFICQLSENFPFMKRPEAPKQPGTFNKDAYCLFLGNSTYLFSHAQPTDPQDVWIGLQN